MVVFGLTVEMRDLLSVRFGTLTRVASREQATSQQHAADTARSLQPLRRYMVIFTTLLAQLVPLQICLCSGFMRRINV